MVVKNIMVPVWVFSIVRHLYLGDPKEDHDFDNHPIWVMQGISLRGLFYGSLLWPLKAPRVG